MSPPAAQGDGGRRVCRKPAGGEPQNVASGGRLGNLEWVAFTLVCRLGRIARDQDLIHVRGGESERSLAGLQPCMALTNLPRSLEISAIHKDTISNVISGGEMRARPDESA